MTDGHGASLPRRVLAEHRRLLYPLAIALGVNVLAYAFIVYPLSQRVANIEDRTRNAEIELAAARGEHTRAGGTVTGKDRAAKELDTFYSQVLPQDVAGARRLTTLRLQQLARQSDLMSETARIEEIEDREKRLRGLRVDMQLAGTYAAMRAFIYQLETAAEFVIIENVQLSEATEEGLLRVNVQVSTYYRSGPS